MDLGIFWTKWSAIGTISLAVITFITSVIIPPLKSKFKKHKLCKIIELELEKNKEILTSDVALNEFLQFNPISSKTKNEIALDEWETFKFELMFLDHNLYQKYKKINDLLKLISEKITPPNNTMFYYREFEKEYGKFKNKKSTLFVEKIKKLLKLLGKKLNSFFYFFI